MNKQSVTKWAATCKYGVLIVTKGTFLESAKTWTLPKPYGGDIHIALNYHTHIPRDSGLLHDTREDALRALRSRTEAEWLLAQAKANRFGERVGKIDKELKGTA